MLTTTRLPSLEEVFGSRKPLMRWLQEQGIIDIVPLMATPESSAGVDVDISALLAQAGVVRRQASQRLADYTVDQFGRTRYTPLSILQVYELRDGGDVCAKLRPLKIVDYLIAQASSGMVDDLFEPTPGTAIHSVLTTGVVQVKDVRLDFRQEILRLQGRLRNISLEFEVVTNGRAGYGFHL